MFLRHYCLSLTGPTAIGTADSYPADVRAARGFNGDLARHAEGWRREAGAADPHQLARRVGRKTLLALSGLVSVHDRTWTTDRAGAARRWAAVQPVCADQLTALLAWGEGTATPSRAELEAALRPSGVVAAVEASFADQIGLWR